MNVASALDLQVILCEKVGWKAKDFEKNFSVEEYEDYCILKQKGFMERESWNKVFGATKDLGGRYLAGLRAFEVPFTTKEAHEEMDENLKNVKEAGQKLVKGETQSTVLIQKPTEEVERITYEHEWLDNVIIEGKKILTELAKETFVRYRKMGQLVLDSGYEKGLWKEEHKQKAIDEWGVSQGTFSRMVRLGELSEEEFSHVVTNFPSFHNWIHKGSLEKKAKRQRDIQILREASKYLEPPKGEYDVIVVDPPWPYGTDYDPENWRGSCPYPEMSLEEIKSIKLPIAENCILWLWTTNAFLHDAFHILETWGFIPKIILTWGKTKFGVGVWLRGQTEHCILATRGNPIYDREKAGSYTTLLIANVGSHSEKPEEFYELVDAVCPGFKLDYFGRKKREGWTVYGTMEQEKSG